jgi:hypothetical protein
VAEELTAGTSIFVLTNKNLITEKADCSSKNSGVLISTREQGRDELIRQVEEVH